MQFPVLLIVPISALVFRVNCLEYTVGPDNQAASPIHPQPSPDGLLYPDFSGEEHYTSNGLDGLEYFEDNSIPVGVDKQLKKDVTEQNQIELRGNSGKGSIKKLIKSLESMERKLTQANQELKMELQTIKEHQANISNMNTEFKTDLQSVNIDITNIKEYQVNISNISTEIKDNMTRYNANNDVKLDSIRASLTSIGAVITNHTTILESIKDCISNLATTATTTTTTTTIAPTTTTAEPCPAGCFELGTGECFKYFKDIYRNWTAANSKCAEEGLYLAEPSDEVAATLGTYLVNTYDPSSRTGAYVWLGAKADGSKWMWQRAGTQLLGNNTLWWPGYGTNTASTKCLVISAYRVNWNSRPGKPYLGLGCSPSRFTLCQKF